jgi:hypothetical protein
VKGNTASRKSHQGDINAALLSPAQKAVHRPIGGTQLHDTFPFASRIVQRYQVEPLRQAPRMSIARVRSSTLRNGRDQTCIAGEQTNCIIGECTSHPSLVATRPGMTALLDTLRITLEDLGGGLGVTDPVSGEAVLEM